MAAGYGASLLAGQQLGPALSLASGVLCIGGIAGLASQSTARMGNVMGMSGVALGVTSVLGTMPMDPGTAVQVAAMMGGGGLAGHQIASKWAPRSCPSSSLRSTPSSASLRWALQWATTRRTSSTRRPTPWTVTFGAGRPRRAHARGKQQPDQQH